MVGAYASIRPLVVGPALPMTCPGFAGGRSYIVDRGILRIKGDLLSFCQRLAHSLVSGVTGCVDRSGKEQLISRVECLSKFLCEW